MTALHDTDPTDTTGYDTAGYDTARPGGLVDHLNATADPGPARRQPGTLVELFVAGEPEPYTVRVVNRDRLAYEKAAARHKEWPPMETGRNFAMTFVCWNAARRAQRTALTFDQWQEALEDFTEVAEVPADPTR